MEPNRKLRLEIERHIRRERISKVELARRLDMSPQYLSDILTGRRSRLPKGLTKVLGALELEIELKPQDDSGAVPGVPNEIRALIDASPPLQVTEGSGMPRGSRSIVLHAASVSDAVTEERDEQERSI